MEEKLELKENKTAEFLKNAFCIDGKCEFVSYQKSAGVIYKDTPRESMRFKLYDSKRGVFYVEIGQ